MLSVRKNKKQSVWEVEAAVSLKVEMKEERSIVLSQLHHAACPGDAQGTEQELVETCCPLALLFCYPPVLWTHRTFRVRIWGPHRWGVGDQGFMCGFVQSGPDTAPMASKEERAVRPPGSRKISGISGGRLVLQSLRT